MNRLTVVKSIFHQVEGMDPMQAGGHYDTLLESSEMAYQRLLLITTDVKPLDLGWVKNCRLLVISNQAGTGLQRTLSVEEQQAIDETVMELGYVVGETFTPFALIFPGDKPHDHSPPTVENLALRCRANSARALIHAIPY